MIALVVDDDHVLADVLAFTLRREGFRVIQAYDGEAALLSWTEEKPDIVVLDVNMPKLDGFAVCRRIREQADTPIILLTVRGEDDDVIRGLSLGADDYITKPFSPRQLVARTHAVLRRAGTTTVPAVQEVGILRLDHTRRELRVGQGEAVSLAPLENRLAAYLLLNAGHVLTADAIINHVWGPEGADRDMLRQLVHRLRSKLAQAAEAAKAEPDPYGQAHIETVPGLGYGLIVPSLRAAEPPPHPEN